MIRTTILCLAAAVMGCSAESPAYRLNMEGREADSLSLTQRETLVGTMAKLFGTPNEPTAPAEAGLDLLLVRRAAGPLNSNEDGSRHGLYRQHCISCHGLSGGGVGFTAAIQEPYPRDFRQGVFKFTSTEDGEKPTREDLLRIMRRGITDTSMPAFSRLPEDELQSLVEYVRYLSIRGETELFLFRLVVDEDEHVVRRDEIIDDAIVPTADMWDYAEQTVVEPAEVQQDAPVVDDKEELRAAIERGRELYTSNDARCASCHGLGGHGDGEQAAELFDEWNRPKKGITPEQTAALAEDFRLPLQGIRPRDFTQGIFRAGSEPMDLYWRICVGIKGTPMPAGGPSSTGSGVLTSSEIWDVVHFVRSYSQQ